MKLITKNIAFLKFRLAVRTNPLLPVHYLNCDTPCALILTASLPGTVTYNALCVPGRGSFANINLSYLYRLGVATASIDKDVVTTLGSVADIQVSMTQIYNVHKGLLYAVGV